MRDKSVNVISNPIAITILTMKRLALVSKESMIDVIRNRTHREILSPDTDRMIVTGAGSVDDDFDRFLSKLKIGQKQNEEVKTCQFHEQTAEELQLVKARDPDYLRSFQIEPSSSAVRGLQINESHKMFARISCSRLTMFRRSYLRYY